jgi:hypothetical protein
MQSVVLTELEIGDQEIRPRREVVLGRGKGGDDGQIVMVLAQPHQEGACQRHIGGHDQNPLGPGHVGFRVCPSNSHAARGCRDSAVSRHVVTVSAQLDYGKNSRGVQKHAFICGMQ